MSRPTISFVQTIILGCYRVLGEDRSGEASLSPTFFRSVSDEIPAKRTLLVLDRLLSSVDPVDGHLSHLTGPLASASSDRPVTQPRALHRPRPGKFVLSP